MSQLAYVTRITPRRTDGCHGRCTNLARPRLNSGQPRLKATPTYNWETPWSTLAPVGGILVAAKTTQTTRVYTRNF